MCPGHQEIALPSAIFPAGAGRVRWSSPRGVWRGLREYREFVHHGRIKKKSVDTFMYMLLLAALVPCTAFLQHSPGITSKNTRLAILPLCAAAQAPLGAPLSGTNEFGDNLGPQEKVQRALNRDSGVGRAQSVSNTHARLIELRRRGLKYDGTPMSSEEKAADAAKLMENMMREAEDFMGGK